MGKLVQVATNTVTSPVASVTLTGIDSDDVYLLTIVGASASLDNDQLRFRYTESGTPNITANYDYAYKAMRSGSTAFSNLSSTNLDHGRISWLGEADDEYALVGMHYIYNANNSSEYTFMTVEQCNGYYISAELLGFQGGNVFTVTSAVNGIQLYYAGSNLSAGTFTLYKVI